MVAAKSAAPLDSEFWKLSLAFVSLPSPAEDRRQHEPAGTQPFFYRRGAPVRIALVPTMWLVVMS